MRKSAPLSFGSISARPPLALPGQRIGIMGGTFDPPHAGHLAVSKTALRRLRLDRLWWVVTPGNPLKPEGALSLEERLAASRALTTDPRIVVTAFEAQLSTPYTAATLAFLKRRYPGVRFVWVMGADNLATLHRWRRWRDIAAAMPMVVVDRPGWHLKALASPAARAFWRARRPEAEAARLPFARPPAWTFLTSRLSPVSSTELRAARQKGDAGKTHAVRAMASAHP